ncbi:uncharacterized protein FYW47_000208 [Aplochiton taeniatus]
MGQTQPRGENDDEEIDVKALQDMYKKFVLECPSGVLFLHEFKRFFGVTPTGEVSDYAECMFRAFDKNGDNTIDFLEFVAALNIVFRGDLEHKLRWSFKVYDKNGNGYVDREELKSIIDSIYRMKKWSKKDLDDSQLTVDEVVDRILQAVDVDGDGNITMEEFMKGAQHDPWILNMLQLDMNPYGWVLEQRRKTKTPFGVRMGQNMDCNSEQLDQCDIQELYKNFIMDCPSGSLYLHEFKKMFGVASDNSPESQYMDCLFRAFDMNNDDTMDFIEYVAALNLVLRGRLEDKLRWSFKVFDTDENGRLDRRELKRIIKIIYKIRYVSAATDEETLTPDQVSDRIFEKIDQNGDGQISLEEFVEGAQSDPWVEKFLRLDVNPSGWVHQHLKDKKLCAK